MGVSGTHGSVVDFIAVEMSDGHIGTNMMSVNSSRKHWFDGAKGTDCKGKRMFIKDDILRDDMAGFDVKAMVPFVMIGVTKEDAQRGSRSELMCGGSVEVGMGCTPEDTKMIICGYGAKEGLVCRREVKYLGGQEIKKIDGVVECFNPVRGRNCSLKKQ